MASLETSLSRPQQSRILGLPRSRKLLQRLNHRFFDFMKFAFWAVHNAENELSLHCNYKKSRFLSLPSRIFGCTRGRKNVSSLMSPWTSCFRPQTIRILGWSRGRKWVQSDMGALETSQSLDSPKSNFGLVKMKKMSSECLASIWNIAFSTSSKTKFGHIKRQKMTF